MSPAMPRGFVITRNLEETCRTYWLITMWMMFSIG